MFKDKELQGKVDRILLRTEKMSLLNSKVDELREILIRLVHDNQQTKVRVKNIKKNLK